MALDDSLEVVCDLLNFPVVKVGFDNVKSFVFLTHICSLWALGAGEASGVKLDLNPIIGCLTPGKRSEPFLANRYDTRRMRRCRTLDALGMGIHVNNVIPPAYMAAWHR